MKTRNKSMTPEGQAEMAAKLLGELGDLMDGDEGLKTMASRMKALEGSVEELAGLDIGKAVEKFEQLQEGLKAVENQIRTSRSGAYVPGLEDESKNFSLVRLFNAVREKNLDKAPNEKAIIDAVREKAAQSVGDDEMGGFFVPDQVIPDVISALYKRSAFINLTGEGDTNVTVVDGLRGGNVKIPRFDGGTQGYWIGEEDDYTESSATVGDVSMNPKKAGVLLKMTDTMRKMTGYGLEGLIRNDMVEALGNLVDYAIPYGTGGANKPRGIMHNPKIRLWSSESSATVENNATAINAANGGDWQGAEMTFDDLENALLAIEEGDITLDSSQRFIAAKRFFTRLRQIKVSHYSGQAAEKAYLLGSPMLSNARLAELIGQFSWSNQLPTTGLPGASVNAPTTSTDQQFGDVFMGNMNTILFGRWGGLEIEDDQGKGIGFKSDHFFLKIRMYCDIGFRREEALLACPDAQMRG